MQTAASGVPLPAISFQLESEEEVSETAIALLSGDVQVRYLLRPLLPPLLGPDPSFLLLFLQFLLAIAESLGSL